MVKNQKYLFDLAKKLKDYKVRFHFIGNMADNFKDYWQPLLTEKQNDIYYNCFIYGEREDVDLFYQAADLLIHPSL